MSPLRPMRASEVRIVGDSGSPIYIETSPDISIQVVTPPDDSIATHDLNAGPFTATILNGESDSDIIDAEKNYKLAIISCEDASGIQANTKLTVKVSYEGAGAMMEVYEENDPSTRWRKEDGLPIGAQSFTFLFTHGYGMRRISFHFDKNATADVIFKVRMFGEFEVPS